MRTTIVSTIALSALAAAQKQVQLVLPDSPAGVGVFPSPAEAYVQGSDATATTYVFTCAQTTASCTNYDPAGWTVTVNPSSAHWALVYPDASATWSTTIDYAYALQSGSYAGAITYAGSEFATTSTTCAQTTVAVNLIASSNPTLVISEGGSAVSTMTGGKPTTYGPVTPVATVASAAGTGVAKFTGDAPTVKSVGAWGMVLAVTVAAFAML